MAMFRSAIERAFYNLRPARRIAAERDDLARVCDRLLRETAESLAREEALKAECAALYDQRDALERGQNEFARHCERLSECERYLEQQRAALVAERDELKAYLARAESELQKLRSLLWTAPGHFYSPVVDPGDGHVQRIAAGMRAREFGRQVLPGLNEAEMLRWMERIARHYSLIPFGAAKANGSRYYFDNTAFSYSDAITLFGLLLELRPQRLIEAGCGFSSCAIIDVNERFLSDAIELTFIDPYPEMLLSLLAPDDPNRARIRAMRLQDVPLDVFGELRDGDMLFLDTSHVAKTGSDVCDCVFRILPALAAGVIVHIHDVLYPFEYPADWITKDNRSWNEAYFLRAFLQYNDSFEIMYWNDFAYNEYSDLTERLMPLCKKNTGGSIWLRKVR